MMTVYWKDIRRGQNLIFNDQGGHEEVIGGFRETKRGIDDYAQTFGYDPGRSRKGFATYDDAKDFVESFRPWEQHGVPGAVNRALPTGGYPFEYLILPIRRSITVAGDYDGFAQWRWTEVKRGLNAFSRLF